PLTVYGDGSQTRSFQYVDDLVEALVRLRHVDYRHPVNLGNPDERSIRDLAELVLELVPSAAGLEFHSLPEDDPQQRRPDITLAHTLMDWSPEVSLEQGLRRTIAY
ncbi:MAG: GDP-mannose 4,6-dehydratase, partial [Bradymonadaceae bacterium]